MSEVMVNKLFPFHMYLDINEGLPENLMEILALYIKVKYKC